MNQYKVPQRPGEPQALETASEPGWRHGLAGASKNVNASPRSLGALEAGERFGTRPQGMGEASKIFKALSSMKGTTDTKDAWKLGGRR